MAIIERLLMSQSVTTAQLHGYDQPTYVDGKPIESRAYQDYGSDGVGVHIASLVPEQAYETRDLLRQVALAIKLIRAKLPLLADHLSQRISTPLGSANPLHMPHKDVKSPTHQRNLAATYDREWRYTDDETQWTIGPILQFDGSNLFVRDRDGSGRTWQIRFGQHECIVDGSDGMWLLSAMLLYPGKELSVDQVCNEAGVSPGRDNFDPGDTKLPGRQLSDFRELAMEFADVDQDGDLQLPESLDDLIDDLKLLLPGLKKSAIESHVASTLKGKGITRASRHHVGGAYTVGDFKESVAKMRRCERLIADLQEWRRKDQSRPPTEVTEQDMANEVFRARGWVIRSVTTTIDEINSKNAFLGSYFRRALRTENGRFTLDVDSKWNVVR